jgi:hypothetical protein
MRHSTGSKKGVSSKLLRFKTPLSPHPLAARDIGKASERARAVRAHRVDAVVYTERTSAQNAAQKRLCLAQLGSVLDFARLASAP